MRKKLIIAFALLYLIINFGHGQAESQWRGPNRDGIYPGEKLLKVWPKSGPRLIWFYEDIGQGYSSAAVTSDSIYLTGMTGSNGFLYALTHEGKLKWKSAYGPEWNEGHPGSRTTPTVTKQKIYLCSGQCKVYCFDKNGKVLWSVDLVKRFQARNLGWGMTESLLVDGNRIFCTPGGPQAMMVILNRHSGKTIKIIPGNGEKSGYCSPIIVKHGKRRLLLTMTQKSVVGLDADSGQYLWSYPHVTSYYVNANTPLYHKGWVYSISGYGTGGKMLKLTPDGTRVTKVWAQRKPDSQMGAAVLVDGYIYTSGHNSRKWTCLSWKDGEIKYADREMGGKGNIIFADGMLYVYSEKGYVALVKPNPEKFEVISSFKITKGSDPHWSHLVINNGRLYIRHGEAIMVYDIAG